MTTLNFSQIKKAFLIGIKGVGMSALAYVLNDMGINVVGSDVDQDFVTAPLLKKRRFKIYHSFDPNLITQEKPDLVITTGAHQGTRNPQFKQALKLNLPALTHAQSLGQLMRLKNTGISIAGVGGKTTITSLTAHIFFQAQLDPAYLIGAGTITPLTWPGRWGKGNYFIAEADEYATCPLTNHQPRFSWQNPKYLVFTNINYDHPDIYKDINHTLNTFTDFALKTLKNNGHLIIFYDNPNNQTIINTLKNQGYSSQITTYGFSNDANFQLVKTNFHYPYSNAILKTSTATYHLKLRLPGTHNLLNATAALITAHLNNIPIPDSLYYLSSFQSVQRRFEFIGKYQNTLIFDDYAHHPNEIKTTLQAALNWFPHKTIAVLFQSHTISRTKTLLNDFANSLQSAHYILIAPIFTSAREKETSTNYQHILYNKTKTKKTNFTFMINDPDKLKNFINQYQPDVLITMGAGDIYKWGQALVFSQNNHEK